MQFLTLQAESFLLRVASMRLCVFMMFSTWLAFGLLPAAGAEPELKAIFPTACTRGASVEIVVNGKGFDAKGDVYFSRSGLMCEHIDKNRYRVSAADNALLGDCDMWIATAEGLAGPRRFHVASVPTLIEVESDKHRGDNDAYERAQPIAIPSIVEGRLDKRGDLDWFVFAGKQGDFLAVAVKSPSLDGSVQPVFTLCDASGREIAFSSTRQIEPMLTTVLPSSGRFFLRLHDRAYLQSDANHYRLELGSGPRLSAIYPHAVSLSAPTHTLPIVEGPEAGQPKPLSLSAADLGTLEISPTRAPGLVLPQFRLRRDAWYGAARFSVSTQPLVSESPASKSAGPLSVPVPCRVVGRFMKANEVDWFRFAAKKGDSFRFESYGERLGQQMDLELVICDANRKPLKEAADIPNPKDLPATLSVASLDAALEWSAPQDGDYMVAIRDLYGGSVFGPTRGYELVIERKTPAFWVVALTDKPSQGLSIKQGGSAEIKVAAMRWGGFGGPITIRAEQSARTSEGGAETQVGTAGKNLAGSDPINSVDLTIAPSIIEAKKSSQSVKIIVAKDAAPGFHVVRLVAEAKMDSDEESPLKSIRVGAAALIRTGVTRRVRDMVVYVRK